MKTNYIALLLGVLGGFLALVLLAGCGAKNQPTEAKKVEPLSFKLPVFAVDYERQPDGKIILTGVTGRKFLTTEAEIAEYNHCQEEMDKASERKDTPTYNAWLHKRPKMTELEK